MRHPPLSTLCVAAVVAAVCSSCATLEDVRSYNPPSLAAPHNVPDQALLHAAQLHAQAQGWNVVLVDPSESRLEALADEEVSDGLRTRNRWIFEVRNHRLETTLRLEAANASGGRWYTSKVVCDGYSYAREKEQLMAVMQLARPGAGVQVARYP